MFIMFRDTSSHCHHIADNKLGLVGRKMLKKIHQESRVANMNNRGYVGFVNRCVRWAGRFGEDALLDDGCKFGYEIG